MIVKTIKKNCESDPTWVVASSRALVTSTFLLVYSFLQFTSGFSPGGEGGSSAAGGGGPVTLPPVPGLTTYSCFFLVSKSLWFAWRANEWPRIGEDIDLSEFSATLSSQFMNLEGFGAELTALFKGHQPFLVPCFANFRHTKTSSCFSR